MSAQGMVGPIARSGMLLVGALASVPGRALADDCIVTGTTVTLENVRVQPAGAGIDPLDLDLKDVPVRATIRTGALVDLEVGGAITFKATTSKVWWTIAARTETADRTVSLMAGAHLVNAHADGDSVIADAVLHSSDIMVGEAKDPDEKVGPVRVACDKLTLDWSRDDTAEVTTGGDDTNYRPRKHGNKLLLRAAPNAKAAAITVIAPDCSGAGCITLERVEHRAGWLLLATANEGVRAAGWVRTSDVVRLPSTMGVGRSYMCTGDHGRSEMFGGSFPVDVVQADATLKVGTTIYADLGDGAWATVVATGPFRVRFRRGDPWAEVIYIPGLDGDVSAYVPMSAVTLTSP